MKRIKRTVSLTLDIAAERLNEISLEDVEIEPSSQHRIYEALCDMALRTDRKENLPDDETALPGIPCTGFWVEDTRELILFAWRRDRNRTIVIPAEEWVLRQDITVH